MRLNLAEVPFSYRGSYLAFSYRRGEPGERGLYLRTVHGSAGSSYVAKLLIGTEESIGEEAYEAVPGQLVIAKEGRECRLAFADSGTLLFYGNLEVTLDFMNQGTFAQPYRVGERSFWLMNCPWNSSRYMLRAQEGELMPEQDWKVNTSAFCRMRLKTGPSGKYLVVLEENFEDWTDRGRDFSFEEAVGNSCRLLETFSASMPSVPSEYAEAAKMAAYVDWASFVKPCGLFRREAMLMSKNWMCSVWSWDHCFNALALAYHNPREAWDQFMLMFDDQKPSGNIPDCVNDGKVVHNYCKPPIHGWTLRKMMQLMELSEEQLRESYEKLSRWTNWWTNSRDANRDGLCEYTHGNDSGWDNSTAFRKAPPVTLPDLAAFLSLQMDVLGELAERLNAHAEALLWKERSERMLEKMLTELFEDGLPAAFAGLQMEPVETDSLILYLPIVLGKRLPEQVRQRMIDVLKGEKFRTAHGLATESPGSAAYEADGYWRGPIWAPSTMLILDGLWACGEQEYVRDMTRRFCDMAAKSGCAENFDAMSGEGLRDRAYTWTASAMLVMAHEYLTEGDGERSCQF